VTEKSSEKPGQRLLAAVRRFNRDPRLLERVRRTRERALGDEHLIDHLSTARGRPADLAARQLVAFRGEEHGVAGELGLTALQAWQRLAESQDRGRGKVDVAILFTDLVGFSSWVLEAGDRAAIRLLREVAEAIEPPIAARQGEVVKRLGDGLMAAFWDAPNAAAAAFAAHERIGAIEVEGYRPRLRTGIHLGRPRKLGGDYFGIDVNIAARLADAAKPDEILVSDRALETLDPAAVESIKRRFRAKGAPRDLAAYAVTRRTGSS
jgi:adenylate cyclase